MSLLDDLLTDLTAEGDQLRAAVAGLDDAGWHRATPAEGWDVATQVGHLVWTDEKAAAAAASVTGDDPAAQQAWDDVVVAALEHPEGFVDAGAADAAATEPEALLARWDDSRRALAGALRAVPEGARMPWFGPPMSPASMATARFMETWAHALDVYAALGVEPVHTDRIRHVAHLGVRTRDFAFGVHGLNPPAEPFRVELVAPSGETWTWGPDDAAQRVTGTALDFCQLVTQRIHREDTALETVGDDAAHWLTIAQAFAGPAGHGRDTR